MPPTLMKWVQQLSYFLMHFPDVYGGIEPLRRLEKLLLNGTMARDWGSHDPWDGQPPDILPPSHAHAQPRLFPSNDTALVDERHSIQPPRQAS